MTASFLSLTKSCLYTLPLSPLDLVKAPPPFFGLAVMVDQAECSDEERRAYAASGIEARAGYRLRFPDAAAGYVYAAYYAELSSICAWRDGQAGMWDALADELPEMAREPSRYRGLGELVGAMMGMVRGDGAHPPSSGFRYALVGAGNWWCIEDAHLRRAVGEYSAGDWVRAVRECARLNGAEEVGR
jgi:hypothetical protein